jgi:release factor glutamine methyltransferase
MRTVLKNIVYRTYKPLLVRYLSKTRTYKYGRIRLKIPPGIFHPGFFFSTQLLIQYIDQFSLKGKTFLELGAGSGLIAIDASNKGATVMATDINPLVIEHLKKNSSLNRVDLEVMLSDLFEAIPVQSFDFIAINPPYYKRNPKTWADHAWHCGENGEYFDRLFKQLPAYIHKDSQVIMILCDGCDIKMVEAAAASNHFRLRCKQAKQSLLEKNFIFKIEQSN